MFFRLIRPGQSLRERNTNDVDPVAANAAEYRCCLCLHVKTGTLLLGLWQVWVQLFVVSFLLAILINPSILGCIGGGRSAAHGAVAAAGSFGGPADSAGAAAATSPVSAPAAVPVDAAAPASVAIADGRHGVEHSLLDVGARRRLGRQDHALLLLIGLVSLLLALLLVVGALRERAKYLMPYFCMQLFDFVINCLTVVGYFSYLPDAKSWLSGHHWPHDAAVRRFLLGLDDATLGFLMLVACMLYLMSKAYLLGMVWACYKYLLRKEAGHLRSTAAAAARRALDGGEFADFDDFEAGVGGASAAAAAAAAAAAEPLLPVPPKYEDALKQPANLNAPPPYFPGAYGRPPVAE